MEEATDNNLDGMQSQFCIGYTDEAGIRSLEQLLPYEVQQVDIDSPDGAWDKVKYPEFFRWRFEQIFGNSKEFLFITPDMMDEYFKEPDDPLQTRCPRCYSTEVMIGYPDIKCLNCGLEEPLLDFPISYDFHLALTKEFNGKR